MEWVNESDHPAGVLELFARITDAVAALVAANTDWGWSGQRPSQYAIDLKADAVCVTALLEAGFDVLSEESGVTTVDGGSRSDRDGRPIVVVDPIDGSTNAGLGLPWCATALCLVVGGAPAVATVANLRTGDRFEAVRGRGATLDGEAIAVSDEIPLCEAIIGVNSRPPDDFGSRQFRALGATALDICSVAAGGLDGYLDCDPGNIAVWDYLASVVVLREAGGVAADVGGRDLMTVDHEARRSPVVASGPGLLAELVDQSRR